MTDPHDSDPDASLLDRLSSAVPLRCVGLCAARAVLVVALILSAVAFAPVPSTVSPVGTASAAISDDCSVSLTDATGVAVNEQDDEVYVSDTNGGNGMLYAYDFNCNQLWSANPGDYLRGETKYNPKSDQIIISTNNGIDVRSATDGSLVTTKSVSGITYGAVTVDKETGAWYAAGDSQIKKYNQTNDLVWSNSGAAGPNGLGVDPSNGDVASGYNNVENSRRYTRDGTQIYSVSYSAGADGVTAGNGYTWTYNISRTDIAKLDTSGSEVLTTSVSADAHDISWEENTETMAVITDNDVSIYDTSLSQVDTTSSHAAGTSDHAEVEYVGIGGEAKIFVADGNDFAIMSTGQEYTQSTSTESSSSSGYTHTFALDDNTGNFDDDPTLTADALNADSPTIDEDDWEYADSQGFNHENEATLDLDEDTLHRLTVRDGDAAYEEIGWRPIDEPDPYNLTIGEPTDTPTPTPTGNESACQLLERDDGSLDLVCNFESDVSSFDYSVVGPNGSLYNASLDFDEPTSYYQGDFTSNFTNDNLTDGSTSLDDLDVAWDGAYENGTSFNGSTSLFAGDSGGFSFGGGGGPTGKPGDASGTQQAIAWSLLAGLGYAGYRRFSDGPTISQVASKAPQAISSVTKRLPGLRGGR